MATVTIEFPDYDPAHGVVSGSGLGDVTVGHDRAGVSIMANRDGLRDLARWCFALADEHAPDGSHVHLEPGTDCLAGTSLPLLISREDLQRL